MFVRNFSATFNQTIGQAASGVVDTSVMLVESSLATHAAMGVKSFIIHGIDWRSQFITTALPTSGHGFVVYEGLYRDQVNNSGSGIHTGTSFLASNEIGGGASQAQFPSRILMRRMDIADEAVGVPDVSMNWHPLRIRNKCRLAIDEGLFWRVELVNGSVTGGNWSTTFYCLAAVAYSVIT